MRKWMLALCSLAFVGCASWGSKNKEKSELYLRIGVSYIESGNYPFALRELLKAEELDPKNPVVQNNLGQVYFLRERFDLAEQKFSRAIELKSDYTDARNNLARTLIEVGKYQAAEKELTVVFNDLTYSGVTKAYINWGLSKFLQKDYSGARSAFGKVLETQSDDCVANTYYGRSLFEEKDYSRAAEALDRAVGFCQKGLIDEPHYYSALAYYRLGEKSKAIARFEELIKYYPQGKYRDKAKALLDLIRKGQQ
ncbi:tetratricopeptide repeat protein [Bdellovibrio sp. HCB2-146]|uniref:tetratricopeptide repeat protein n=1 Tax=Bdellovibrio sp. HCB2-146 TaxID=3394362 RepID=UPI0039BD15E2